MFWKLHRRIARCEGRKEVRGQLSEWLTSGVCRTTGGKLGGHSGGDGREGHPGGHATGLAGPGLFWSGRDQRPWLVVWVSVQGESGGHLHPCPPAGGEDEA